MYICINDKCMPLTIRQLESQLTAMKMRLSEQPKEINGKYNTKYYSLTAKIRNTQALIDKMKWHEFLAK